MNNLERLILARAVIEDPARWTRRSIARSAFDNEVLPHDPRAVCWCAMGACCLSGADLTPLLLVLPGNETLPSFNDDERKTHADILNLFDRAIDKLL